MLLGEFAALIVAAQGMEASDPSTGDFRRPHPLPDIKEHVYYDPRHISGTVDKIHNIFQGNASEVQEHAQVCAEAADIVSELLPLICEENICN